MKVVLLFLHLWALPCAISSSPPSPASVNFSSVNLKNTLRWFPGNGTPGDAHFTVQYAIYGDSVVDGRGRRRAHWRAVPRCTGMSLSWCDLSSETWDLEDRYFARVRAVSRRASSGWALTKRFDPKSDTSFGPPLVSVELQDSAIITLMGPMRYRPDNQTPVVSMATLYPQMMYNLSIHNKGRGQMNHFTVVSSPYKFRPMEHNTEYCFSAKTKMLSMPAQCQSSEWHCITTPPDPAIDELQKLLVGIVLSSVCLCVLMVAGYLLYQYLMGIGQKSPYILNLPSFNLPPLTFPPERPNLILITIIQPSDVEKGPSDPTSSKQGPFLRDPPPGYAPQRADVPPEPEDPWSDASTEYGFVFAAPKSDVSGGEENRENRPDGGGDGNMRTETCSLTRLHSVPLTQSETPPPSGKVDGGENEGMSLLSACASENINMLPSYDDQSDFLPDDYGVLRMATANNLEADDDGEEEEEEEEEEEGPILINWDPITRQLVLPEIMREFTDELWPDRSMQGERGRDSRLGGEEGEEEERNAEITLENVFVRQASEEEAQRQLERDGQADDIFAKWNLVISMEE